MYAVDSTFRRLASCVLLFFGCGAGVEADVRILEGTLWIDHEFTQEQQAQIEAAVRLWREATGGAFSPTTAVGPVSCGQAFAIKAIHSSGCRVGQVVADAAGGRGREQRVLGAADARDHSVTVVSWLSGADFRNNVAHELGHYMLIGHGDGIMAQAREQEPPRVTELSLNEFCAVWGCSPRAAPFTAE